MHLAHGRFGHNHVLRTLAGQDAIAVELGEELDQRRQVERHASQLTEIVAIFMRPAHPIEQSQSDDRSRVAAGNVPRQPSR